jgi:hypothetical protein
MDRRKFIKGTVAAAVAAAIPVGDGVELYSIAHPEYTYKTYKITTEHMPRDLGCQMARALARSMMQTREIVGANVLNKAFGDDHV